MQCGTGARGERGIVRPIANDLIDQKHFIRPHCGLDRRVGAVALHEDVGTAVDVEVGDPKRPLSG